MKYPLTQPEYFGKWEVKEALINDRTFLVESNGQKGVAKIGRAVAAEVAALKVLDHPNIVKLLDRDLEAPIPYLVTEYHGGQSIECVIERHKPGSNLPKKTPTLSLAQRKKIAKGLHSAFSYLEKMGVKKQDCGMNNILLSDGQPILIDFEGYNPMASLDDSYDRQIAPLLLAIIGVTPFMEYMDNL